MTYRRDDDRYYREQLQALGDALDDVRGELWKISRELRDDDEMGTYEARHAIHVARIGISDAAAKLSAAYRRLPTPKVSV